MKKEKYTLKEKLDIAESVVTILMFIMAVWGSLVAYEQGFWHKITHIINHYHHKITDIENSSKTNLLLHNTNQQASKDRLNNL